MNENIVITLSKRGYSGLIEIGDRSDSTIA